MAGIDVKLGSSDKDVHLPHPDHGTGEEVEVVSGQHSTEEGSGLKPKEHGDLTASWLQSRSVWRLLHILNVMRANIQLRTLMTLRGVYYELPLQFNNQGEVDRLIKIAVAMLKVILGVFCLF